MQKIILQRKEIDFNEFIKRPAKREDFGDLIKGDTVVYEEGNEDPILLYLTFKEDTSDVRSVCKDIKYERNRRSDGLTTQSRIFGYDPATGIRKPYCSATSLSYKDPAKHAVITNFGKKISDVYKEYLPHTYAKHDAIVKEKILPEWVIPGTVFTSGIINQNNQLNYHFDSGNFDDVYSNMIVFKDNVAGGYLSLPEYGIGLECADNTLVMFDGQSILHGVTPIKFFTSKAYRYSIVYYSLSQMWNCKSLTGELVKIRNRRKRIELRNSSK